MNGRTPQDTAMALERAGRRLQGGVEHFDGYGVMRLPFALGDILAFRRVTASSTGPPYTAVWHRDPTHRWTIYTTDPGRSGAVRYGRPTWAVRVAEIKLLWTGNDRLAISVLQHHVEWALRLEPTGATRAFNVIAPLVPGRVASRILSWAGDSVVPPLDAGPRGVEGRTPGGHGYRLEPRGLWLATAAAATVDGRDLGPIGSHARHSHPGSRVGPDHGLFVVGREVYSGPSAGRATGPLSSADAPLMGGSNSNRARGRGQG